MADLIFRINGQHDGEMPDDRSAMTHNSAFISVYLFLTLMYNS